MIRGAIKINIIYEHYKIALEAANKSPCSRRKYGVVIAYEDGPKSTISCNSRVTKVCDQVCVREHYAVDHGSMTELGAEVHAEQAALIDSPKKGSFFVLAGLKNNKELKGPSVYPCLVCARMIKYAGYNWIYIKEQNNQIAPISIYDIINYCEKELGHPYE